MPPDLALSLSRTYFHGPEGVRAIDVLLYFHLHEQIIVENKDDFA